MNKTIADSLALWRDTYEAELSPAEIIRLNWQLSRLNWFEESCPNRDARQLATNFPIEREIGIGSYHYGDELTYGITSACIVKVSCLDNCILIL